MSPAALHFLCALALAGVGAAALFALAHALCAVDEAWRRRRGLIQPPELLPYEVAQIAGGRRRRAAGQLLGRAGAWTLALAIGFVAGAIAWRALH